MLLVAGRSTVLSCASCRRQFSSPWSLIHHVQSDHGLRVYSHDRSPTPDSPTPRDSPQARDSPGGSSSSTLSPGREVYSPAAASSTFSFPSVLAAASVLAPSSVVPPPSPTDLSREAASGGTPMGVGIPAAPAAADSCAERLRQLAHCCSGMTAAPGGLVLPGGGSPGGSLLPGAGSPGDLGAARWCHLCHKQLGDTVGLLQHWNETHQSIFRLLGPTPSRFQFPPARGLDGLESRVKRERETDDDELDSHVDHEDSVAARHWTGRPTLSRSLSAICVDLCSAEPLVRRVRW